MLPALKSIAGYLTWLFQTARPFAEGMARQYLSLPLRRRLAVTFAPLVMAVILISGYNWLHRYDVAPNTFKLLPKASVDQKLIKVGKDGRVGYKASDDKSVRGKVVVSDPTNAT